VPLVPPDATAIAITGIVVSGVVGPAFAAGFAARHADRVHELEIKRRRSFAGSACPG